MGNNGSTCLAVVDGTDFRIQEPEPFNRRWYSHKFQGPGVRYEVATCIQTGWIVWINGPFPCGRFPDQVIACRAVNHVLDEGEKYLSDGVYNNGCKPHCETPTGHNNFDQRMKQKARSIHETVNGRFKRFGILVQIYRHNLLKHGYVFRAIANITQLGIMYEEPVAVTWYNDRLSPMMYR